MTKNHDKNRNRCLLLKVNFILKAIHFFMCILNLHSKRLLQHDNSSVIILVRLLQIAVLQIEWDTFLTFFVEEVSIDIFQQGYDMNSLLFSSFKIDHSTSKIWLPIMVDFRKIPIDSSYYIAGTYTCSKAFLDRVKMRTQLCVKMRTNKAHPSCPRSCCCCFRPIDVVWWKHGIAAAALVLEQQIDRVELVTVLFAVLKPQSPWIDEFYVVRKWIFADFETPKLWNALSGMLQGAILMDELGCPWQQQQKRKKSGSTN